MTKTQFENYNAMLSVLKKIAKDYFTPEQLKRNSEKEYGLEYHEALEMAYENIQEEAKRVSRKLRLLKSK